MTSTPYALIRGAGYYKPTPAAWTRQSLQSGCSATMDVTRSGPTSVNVSGNVARSTPPTVRPKLSKRTTSYEIVGDLEEHRLGSWLIGRTIDRRRAVSLALDAHYTRNTLHHSDGTEGVVLRKLAYLLGSAVHQTETKGLVSRC